jgi:hypothetical protein
LSVLRIAKILGEAGKNRSFVTVYLYPESILCTGR